MHVVASFDPSVLSTIPSGSLGGQAGGIFDLKQAGNVKFKIKNDSNISIHCYFPNGSDTVVVAGEEMLFCLDVPTSIVSWIQDTALNVNGAPLVSKVYVTIYDQTDREQGTYPFHITRLANLGNTIPIATSANVSTLSNEANSSQTLVIDIGQTGGHTLLITINSDGSFTWSVLQSGTAHQILKGQTSGNPLLISQASDTTEVKGGLQVDQGFSTTGGGTISILGNGKGSFNVGQVVANDTVQTNANGDTLVKSLGPGNVVFQPSGGGTAAFIGQNGYNLQGGAGNAYNFLVGTMTRIGGGVSACGSGTTISHGLGVTPDLISGTPVGNQPFSATVGIGNAGTTTFQATVGAGSQIDWTAIKG